MSFTRTKENFICEHCGARVEGTGYTNHCPKCLWAKHVDIEPGDRQAACQGMMKPIAARYERDEFVITHQCEKCGVRRTNKSSPSDDGQLLISLTTQPL